MFQPVHRAHKVSARRGQRRRAAPNLGVYRSLLALQVGQDGSIIRLSVLSGAPLHNHGVQLGGVFLRLAQGASVQLVPHGQQIHLNQRIQLDAVRTVGHMRKRVFHAFNLLLQRSRLAVKGQLALVVEKAGDLLAVGHLRPLFHQKLHRASRFGVNQPLAADKNAVCRNHIFHRHRHRVGGDDFFR